MARMGLSCVQGLGVPSVPAPCLMAGGSWETGSPRCGGSRGRRSLCRCLTANLAFSVSFHLRTTPSPLLSEIHGFGVSGGPWLEKDFWFAVYMVTGLGNCRLNSCSVTQAPWSSCHIQNTLFSSLQRSGKIYEIFRLAHVYALINSAGNFHSCHC